MSAGSLWRVELSSIPIFRSQRLGVTVIGQIIPHPQISFKIKTSVKYDRGADPIVWVSAPMR